MAKTNKIILRPRAVPWRFDLHRLLCNIGVEFHWPGYHYMGPGTKLKTRLQRGDPGINRLDKIAKRHDIAYVKAKSLKDKWKADQRMIKAITNLPGKKTWTERIVKLIMQAKLRLNL